MSSVVALHPGAEFAGRYEVVRCIQLGGMGAVYEVVHLETRRRRALKVMLPSVVESEELRERFKLEATVAAEVVSDHIVETFDAGIDEESGAPFLVMELLRGVELGRLIKSLGPLPPRDVVAVLRQVARGLDKTHAAGIVHRDLKPENIFVSERDDGSLWVKILDFGVAKIVTDVTHAAKTKVMGTPLYMAPEQLTGDGRIGPAADLYALGHLAFRLLVGRGYWKEEADASSSIFNFLLQVMDGHPQPACERARALGVTLPEAFDAWFDQATAREPGGRFASGASQIDGLAEVLDVEPDGATSDAFAAHFRLALADGEQSNAPTVSPTAPTQPSEPPPQVPAASALTQRPITRDPVPPSTKSGERRPGWIGGGVIVLAVGAVAAFGAMGGDAPAPSTAAETASAAASSPSLELEPSASAMVGDDAPAPSSLEEPPPPAASSAPPVPSASASSRPIPTAVPVITSPPVPVRPPAPPPVVVPPPPVVDPLKIR